VEIQKNVHAGLALFPEERAHFTKEFIYPYRGVGISPESKDFEIVLFQLCADDCPHLKFQDNLAKCAIYETRPFACKCFPLRKISMGESGQLDYTLDPHCKAIQMLRDKAIKLEASPEEESGFQLLNRMKSIMGNRIWMWLFDLKSMKWRSPY